MKMISEPEKGDSQRVAKWPIVEYQSLVLMCFVLIENRRHDNESCYELFTRGQNVKNVANSVTSML